MFRRRRPLLRAAAVGGAAYYAGKHAQSASDQDAMVDDVAEDEPSSDGLSEDEIAKLRELAELKEKGVLTQDEFEMEKQKILNP